MNEVSTPLDEASDRHLRLAVLGSGYGSNLQAILDAIESGDLNAEVTVVLSDHPRARILELARSYGIPSEFVEPGERSAYLSLEAQQGILAQLDAAEPDLVVLAGFMRIVQSPLLDAFSGRLLNVHPSLLPKYRGRDAWAKALEAGEVETGCTVHLVDEGVDTGEILAQAEVPILEGDTAKSLHLRIQEQEHRLYPQVIGEYGQRLLAMRLG